MNWLKIAVLILIVCNIFSASLAAFYYLNNQNLEKQVEYLQSNVANFSKNATVVVVVNFNNGTVLVKDVHFTTGNQFSAFNATQLAFGNSIDYKYYPAQKDFLITRFFNVYNNANSSRYWILYVNGVASSSGALTTVVSTDDIVEWRYQKF